MPTDAHAAVVVAARALVRALAELPNPPRVRVADAEGRVACLIQVWAAHELMPTAGPGKRRAGRRADCRTDIVEVVKAAGKAVTRKEVMKVLKAAGKDHGPGTVAKALADLTAGGELVNLKDKRGYRLPDWVPRARTPSLF